MLNIIIMFYCRVPIFIDQIRETLISILEKWQTIPSDDETSSDDEIPSDDKMNEIARCLTPEVYNRMLNIYKSYNSTYMYLKYST